VGEREGRVMVGGWGEGGEPGEVFEKGRRGRGEEEGARARGGIVSWMRGGGEKGVRVVRRGENS